MFVVVVIVVVVFVVVAVLYPPNYILTSKSKLARPFSIQQLGWILEICKGALPN